MEKFAITYYFDEIFPTYTEWREFSKQLDCVGETPSNDILLFDKYCYNVLFRNFAKQNIRYSRIETFVNMLANVYEQEFMRFYKEKQLIDNIYKLSNEELVTLNQTLTNIANNPNTTPTNPLQPLNYISTQSFSNVNDNRLQAYLRALNTMPVLNIERFIYGERADPNNKHFLHFNDLFMQVLTDTEYLYERSKL